MAICRINGNIYYEKILVLKHKTKQESHNFRGAEVKVCISKVQKYSTGDFVLIDVRRFFILNDEILFL